MLSNRCASPRPTPRQVFLGGVGLILTAVFTTLGLILIVAGLRGRRRDKVRSSNVGSGASQSGRTNVEVLTHTAIRFARPAPFLPDVADTQLNCSPKVGLRNQFLLSGSSFMQDSSSLSEEQR
ncbi:hypothetical protein AB0O54_21240, partial [Pseudarthrobacter oxydans]|uniref:hypothetical protein n=1 Tax=Pseudarthrobacter oxydans TaxID=1671 RepID=UPI003437D042